MPQFEHSEYKCGAYSFNIISFLLYDFTICISHLFKNIFNSDQIITTAKKKHQNVMENFQNIHLISSVMTPMLVSQESSPQWAKL